MANNLVIVESPAKVKTIKKFLGSSYEVLASNGHVRDLPKSALGVDTEKNFGFKIKAQDMAKVKTLSQFYDYIETQIA